jgi:hypothetical protein
MSREYTLLLAQTKSTKRSYLYKMARNIANIANSLTKALKRQLFY